MATEQLQDADVLPGVRSLAEAAFEVAAKLGERRRKLPVAVDGRVIEGDGFAFQNPQEMQWIKHFLAASVTPLVRGDHLMVGDDRDAIDVPLHGHRAERPPPRHAVAVAVERRRLVLVDLAGMNHAGIEWMCGNRQGRRPIRFEAHAD